MKIEVESFYHGGVSLLDVGAEHVTIRTAIMVASVLSVLCRMGRGL